jgi:hypothetical protein
LYSGNAARSCCFVVRIASGRFSITKDMWVLLWRMANFSREV